MKQKYKCEYKPRPLEGRDPQPWVVKTASDGKVISRHATFASADAAMRKPA